MNNSELKDFIKTCIDAYNISYELPKIIEKTNAKIKSAESEINAVKKVKDPKYIDIDSVPRTRPYEYFVKDCAKELITEEMFPSWFNVFSNETGRWKKWTSLSQKELGPLYKIDGANCFYLWIGWALKKGEAVWDGSDLLVPPDKKLSFPLGYKRVLDKAFQQAYLNARVKADDYNRPASYEQRKKQAEEKNEKARNKYEKEMVKYNNEIYPATVRLTFLEKESENFKQGYDKNQAALTTLLDAGVVHPKYNSLPALCSIYEYLDTGRCTELTGPFGAYQRYEEELRAGKIIASLQNIEQKLDTLINNQRLLAYSIAECGSRIEQTISNMDANVQRSLQSIENNQKTLIKNSVDTQSILSEYASNSTAIRYNTERVARITEYVNSVKLAKGEFSGFEYKYPSSSN